MNNLSTLMRSRVECEHLDLSALAFESIRRGRRIRRVRYAGAGLATAAVVAGVAMGAAALPGGNSAATELQPATGSTFAGPAAPVSPTLKSMGGPQSAERALDPRGIPLASGESTAATQPVPLVVSSPGWKCGAPADWKMECSGPGGRQVVVTVRAVAGYQEWVTDPDKGAGSRGVTTAPHGDYFATIQGNSKTAQEDLHALADSLHWK